MMVDVKDIYLGIGGITKRYENLGNKDGKSLRDLRSDLERCPLCSRFDMQFDFNKSANKRS